MRRAGAGVLGVAVLLGLFEVVGRTGVAGSTWPPLSSVVSYSVGDPGRVILARAAEATVVEASAGLAAGTFAAVAAAALGLVVPWLRAGMSQVAVLLSTVPLIALGPVLVTTVGTERTPAVIAALGSGFAVFVAMSSAFSRPATSLDDLFQVLGATRTSTMVRLRAPAAVPSFFDGLALAAPAALLGAVVGEWFGAPRGIGVLLVSSMQNFDVVQLWAHALCLSVVSLAAYGALTGVRRVSVRRFT
ncbi:ABC transporter permease subunit [Actinomadura decatromicini]|uniref:ABC transporter permease subunit n=1 Tax=Actinomadura decatromicini TaxID=2604572 RepID=A0A5D3FZ90_9ACTN|nr:ABC transporter permease subunit [Actinomadura decatromicini]